MIASLFSSEVRGEHDALWNHDSPWVGLARNLAKRLAHTFCKLTGLYVLALRWAWDAAVQLSSSAPLEQGKVS